MTKNIIKRLISFTLFILLLFYSGCEKEVFVEPGTEIYQNLSASVFVNSNPSGAKIYLNGHITGLVTPDTVKWVTPGNSIITLKKSLFWDTTLTVQTTSGTRSSCFVDYYQSLRMLGAIVCKSTPSGAEIYLDNVKTGKVTPAVINRLIPKVYSVKFDYPEYRKDSVSIILESMSTKTANVVLDDTLDVIKYTTSNSNIPSDYITGIAEDKQGNIWLGTGSEGIAVFNGRSFINYRSSNSSFMKTDFVRRIKSDKDNNIWIGFSNALSRFDGSSWISVPSGSIYAIQINYDNSMLASNDRYGLIKYSNGVFSYITTGNSGLPENDVTSSCYDKTGRLWAAFRNGRIGIYDGVSWIIQDSVHNGMPYSFCCGLNLTTDGKIIGMFYNRPNGPSPTASHTFAIYQNGVWWNIYAGFTAFIEDKDLFIDKSNRTWIAYNGPFPIVCRVNNYSFGREYFYNSIIHQGLRKFINWEYAQILEFFQGNQAFIDSKGNLWIFGNDGTLKIKAGRWFN